MSNRSNWQRVRFGDVVSNVKESIDRENTDLTRYVAGQHMGSADIHIRDWGEINGDYLGPAFHRRFDPGQVLYGSRRTYLKKVAVAQFEGICANTTFVLESADRNVLLQELLPYLMLTDEFSEHSIRESKGSVNPYINWKDIAKFQFVLPPMAFQKKALAVLAAADAECEARRTLVAAVRQLEVSVLSQYFPRKGRLPTTAKGEVELQTLCGHSITYGIVQAGPNVESGVPYIRVSDMVKEELSSKEMMRTSREIASKFERSSVLAGELVFALRGEPGLVRVVPSELEGANLTQGTARISVEEAHNRDFVLWAIRSPRLLRQINIEAKGSTFKEITLKSIRELKVPLYERRTQDDIAHRMNTIRDALQKAESAHAAALNVAKDLREELLGQICNV